MKGRSGKRIAAFLFFGGLILFALSAVLMWLWNFAAVPALGVAKVNYWQAMGLLVLSKILFTGIGPRGGPGGRSRHWKKWREMSPEDRKEFKARWQRHQDHKK